MSEDIKIPEFWEGEIYVALGLEGWNAGEIHARDFKYKEGSVDYLPLGQATVKITLDRSLDPRAALVRGLENQKEKVLADAHIKAEGIQHKIDDLLQIEYTAED